jgi:hypothetical protein
MTSEKKRFFKKTKKVDEQTFEVGFFYKGEEDSFVKIRKDILAEAIEVSEGILKKAEAADFITLYLKKPELIKVQNAFLKKHRLLIEAMDSLLVKHEDVALDKPILSFENMDYYLGMVNGYARNAFKNNSRKKTP